MDGSMSVPVPDQRRRLTNWLNIEGARMHNLKKVDAKIPLNALTVVSGVSGSGKTSLIKGILYPALRRELGEGSSQAPGAFVGLTGDVKQLTAVEMVNQSPIGKSSRSNPVTYVGAYDDIRNLMASQQLSKIRDYKPGFFSFNVDGGRCDTCKGFKREIRDVTYNGKNITEILDLTVEESVEFFKDEKKLSKKLQPLLNVGLGYITLGQSSSTLSGGEAQRVKLASFLTKEKKGEHILFIFDEPTTGLHFHDVAILLTALNALVERGHTVLVVEHNMDVIKSADWVIDLGPEGGRDGGHIVFQGTPEDLAACGEGYTSGYLAEVL